MKGNITRRGKGKGKDGSWRLKWELDVIRGPAGRSTRYKTVCGTRADADAEDVPSYPQGYAHVDLRMMTVLVFRAQLTRLGTRAIDAVG